MMQICHMLSKNGLLILCESVMSLQKHDEAQHRNVLNNGGKNLKLRADRVNCADYTG